jgi:comEA protein
VAAHFVREFERLYQGATLGIPSNLQKKIDQAREKCPPPVSNNESANEPKTDRESELSSGEKVNLNTATQEELESLPGVGPVLAERIIEARSKQQLTSLADLDRVPGIGPKMLEKLGDRVSF